mgnify:CR=1 FL=1
MIVPWRRSSWQQLQPRSLLRGSCTGCAMTFMTKANPINALFAINAAFCLLPLSWLVAAIRANRARHDELVSQ